MENVWIFNYCKWHFDNHDVDDNNNSNDNDDNSLRQIIMMIKNIRKNVQSIEYHFKNCPRLDSISAQTSQGVL